MIPKIISSIIILVFIGCASSQRLSPSLENPEFQDVVYIDGREVLYSNLDSTSVAICAEKTEDNELILHVIYKNNSANRIDIFPERISIIAVNPVTTFYYGEKALMVYPADRYIKRRKTQQTIGLMASGLSGILTSRKSMKTTGTARGVIRVGDRELPYSSTTETIDPGRATEVMSETARDISTTKMTFDENSKVVLGGLLKRNTLFPSQSIEGDVMVEFLPAQKYVVTVPFGPETHTITFTIVR